MFSQLKKGNLGGKMEIFLYWMPQHKENVSFLIQSRQSVSECHVLSMNTNASQTLRAVREIKSQFCPGASWVKEEGARWYIISPALFVFLLEADWINYTAVWRADGALHFQFKDELKTSSRGTSQNIKTWLMTYEWLLTGRSSLQEWNNRFHCWIIIYSL